MQFAWLPCSLILRQEQGSEKESAVVNTRKALWCAMRQKYILSKDLMLGCCLISGIHMLITEYPEQGTHSGKTVITPFYGLISRIG